MKRDCFTLKARTFLCAAVSHARLSVVSENAHLISAGNLYKREFHVAVDYYECYNLPSDTAQSMTTILPRLLTSAEKPASRDASAAASRIAASLLPSFASGAKSSAAVVLSALPDG